MLLLTLNRDLFRLTLVFFSSCYNVKFLTSPQQEKDTDPLSGVKARLRGLLAGGFVDKCGNTDVETLTDISDHWCKSLECKFL